MGIGHRSFIFGNDGSLWRLPEQLSAALAVGQIRLPELANQTWRVASAVLETEDGKPVEVIQITGTLWHFDERGGAQRNLARGAIEALGMHRESRAQTTSAGDTVVDISAQIRRRRWWAEHGWEPTPAEITRMINAIWPKAAGRPGRAAAINQDKLEKEETGVTFGGVGGRSVPRARLRDPARAQRA